MENQRAILYLSFFFILFLVWQAWQKDYGPQPVVDNTAATQQSSQTAKIGDIPEAAKVDHSSSALPLAEEVVTQRQIITVKTDLMLLEIDTRGGDIRQLDLLKYPEDADQPDKPYRLFNPKASQIYMAQTGLISSDAETAPNHYALYRAEKTEYELSPEDKELKVVLHWQNKGVKVDKIFTFKPNSYVINIEHKLQSQQAWSGSQYRQLVKSENNTHKKSKFIYTYSGGVIYDDELKYEKLKFSEMAEKDLNIEMKGGWVAMIQHYFLSAWIAQPQENNLAYSKHPSADRYILGLRSPSKTIQAGEMTSFKTQLVAGPKLQDRLKEIAPGLELTVDYGILTIIAKPLFWILKFFHSIFNNWGWAIIFLTISVKLVFFKLSEASYKSMAKMRKVAPRLKAMKERYGDNRQAMSQAMMKMYKEEKINPLGGCLPILVQMPVFIALYWVLLESVEMRNAPFALWIQNLSAQDPYFILPVLMGATMFIQQKLNPAPMDPMQQKIFQFMPLMFTVFFLFFPSGLVLYWVVNNTLSITQQYIITKRIEAEQ